MAKGKKSKRNRGCIGFGINEIAFIEDEMSAIANEFGLEMDEDIVNNIEKRQAKKKKQRHDRKKSMNVECSVNTSVVELQEKNVLKKQKKINRKNTKSTSTADLLDALLLQAQWDLSKCSVPGCKCDLKSWKYKNYFSHAAELNDSEEHGHQQKDFKSCSKCGHSHFQHTLLLKKPDIDEKDDDSKTKNAAFRGPALLSSFYNIIKLARLSSTTYSSNLWTQNSMQHMLSIIKKVKQLQKGEGKSDDQDTLQQQGVLSSLLVELHSLVLSALQTISTATRTEMPIKLACILDNMYFNIYYSCLVLFGRNCRAVPTPDVFLMSLEDYDQNLELSVKNFVCNELANIGQSDNPIVDGFKTHLSLQKYGNNEHQHIQLLSVFRSCFVEGVKLFYENDVGMDGEFDRFLAQTSTVTAPVSKLRKTKLKSGSKKKMKKEDNILTPMPCYPLLQQWRDNCRDWCCHLYAYATPNEIALNTLAQYQPLVEIGAGTGYWSSLLQKRSIDIIAFDKYPPQSDSSKKKNEYHGQVPIFCEVKSGGPDVLTNLKDRNLFLCYPPPGDSMARDCVRNFQGKFIIHVGEFQGDTGDRLFENILKSYFNLVDRNVLPNWGNTAYELTVWQRNEKEIEVEKLDIISCFSCGTTDLDSLKRCCLCKTLTFCSTACEKKSSAIHSAEHARRLIFLKGSLCFGIEQHYKSITISEKDLKNPDFVRSSSWKDVIADTSSPGRIDNEGVSKNNEKGIKTRDSTFKFNF